MTRTIPSYHPLRLLLAALALAALLLLLLPGRARGQDERLTSRARAATTPPPALKVGDEIRTAADQRKRVTLPDRSTLFVNNNTRVKLDAATRLSLTEGEIYVEAAGKDAIAVKAPRREVSARGAHFGVRALAVGSSVVVTRGKVDIQGLDAPLSAGQQLPPGAARPAASQRASHVLDWTRDLMAAADSPLVPASKHSGGQLTATTPTGQDAKISLRKFHIDVHVEDGFARTTIDQTYFNHEPWQLEGTFYFPLPPDASLSRLAMYVDGQLMEGGIMESHLARDVYETIRYANRDPALLEWLDGSTFKMRVFPVEGRQEKRILLSYTQRLPVLYGQATYRFPAGHSLGKVADWSLHVRARGGADWFWSSPTDSLNASKDNGDLILSSKVKDLRFDRDVVVHLKDTRAGAGEAVRFSTTTHEGKDYFLMRYRPALEAPARAERRDWLFLFETSGDRDPLLARVQIDVIEHLLSQAGPEDTFSVLTAATRVRAFDKSPRPVTPENVQAAVAFLEKSHLVGALDLGQALSEAAAVLKTMKSPYLVHVGSGIAAMGERRQDVLAKRVPDGTRYVGVGVGRRWARSFMKATAERSGGLYAQVNPDEPVRWRAFELFATLNTPRLLNVTVEDDAGNRYLAFDEALAHGEEFAAVTRLPGRQFPATLTVRGTLDGKPFAKALRVDDVAKRADYLPRTWAKLEIDRLLTLEPAKHKDEVVALSKAMYVMTPYTSMLVLENDDMYTQYKVDRGRKDHWAMYPAPAKIAVVYEPDPSQPDPKLLKSGAKLPAKQVRDTVLVRPAPSLLGWDSTAGRPRREELLRQLREEERSFDEARAARISSLRRSPMIQSAEIAREKLEEASLTFYSGHFLRNEPERLPPRTPSRTFTTAVTGVPVLAPDSEPPVHMPPAFGAVRGRPKEGRNNLWTVMQPPGQVPNFRDVWGHLPVDQLNLAISPFVATEDVEKLRKQLKQDPAQATELLYRRPSYRENPAAFADLLAYAPGMNSSDADIEAILDAEAIPDPRDRPGRIDATARKLIDQARAAGWRVWVIDNEKGTTPHQIQFDGKGSFVITRTLPRGVTEQVVCDGTTLLHLYRQFGVGARRTVSRAHRADFADLVPWAVPPAADLARGSDVKLIAERTVAVVPHEIKDKDGKPIPQVEMHLIFGGNGDLAERRLLRGKELLSREVCEAGGTVRVFDGKEKELAVRKGTLRPAPAPDLTPDVKDLVVLPLPYRTPEVVKRALKIEKKSEQELRFDEALPLLASYIGQNNASAAQSLFKQVFHAKNQRQLGFYVLLAACGVNLDAQHGDVLAEHLDEPAGQYLALHSSPVLRKHASQWAVGSGQFGEGLLQHLAQSHALYQRWQSDKVVKGDPARVRADVKRALDYVRRNKGTAYGWALLCLMRDRAGEGKDTDKGMHAALAEHWPLFADVPGLRYAANYEEARALLRAGKRDEARQRFEALYAKALSDGLLPPIDPDFRAALGAGWAERMGKTAAELVTKKHRPAVFALAWQCWQLDERALANHLVSVATENLGEKEELPLRLAAVQFYAQTHQLAEADGAVGSLLKDKRWSEDPALWRLASELAHKREQTARSLECMERALAAEYAKLPESIDLARVREDYGWVLKQYQSLADAMVTLKVAPPKDFLAKAVRAADRWRALDRDGSAACAAAAGILRRLGERELGWDYLTTPVGQSPNEAGPWVGLAQTLNRQGDLDLADRAYSAAFESEPTNAQILWDRAQNLRQGGRTVESRRVLRQLAEGEWQPRFQNLKSQARTQLGGG